MVHEYGIAFTFNPRPEELKGLVKFMYCCLNFDLMSTTPPGAVYTRNRAYFERLLCEWNKAHPRHKYWEAEP